MPGDQFFPQEDTNVGRSGKGLADKGPRQRHSRNGASSKTILTEDGEIEITVPRDRVGSFEPQLIAKGQTHFDGFDDKILSLYARGMTVREIQGHLSELYGTFPTGTTDDAKIDARQQLTCTNFKNADPNNIIHTIQVNSDNEATSTVLRNCASSS